MNDEIDPFADVEQPHEDGLGKLRKLYDRHREKTARKEELEAELKIVNEELRRVEEKDFPELFDEVGITSFTVGNHKVEVQEKLYGSLPKKEDERAKALKLLQEYGGLGILKADVKVTYAKGQADDAKRLAERLLAEGVSASYTEDAHAQTYQAWAREQLREGVNLPLEDLGFYNRRFIKIS